MTFDSLYAAGQQHAVWPFTDVVRLVSRFGNGGKCLELGCGTGANARFLLTICSAYLGIDASETAIAYCRRNFSAAADFELMDFVVQFPAGPWDLIVDRASVTHNDMDGIETTIATATMSTTEGAIYVGVDWFTTGTPDFRAIGECTMIDQYTREYTTGRFAGVDHVGFSTRDRIRALFKPEWEILFMERVRREGMDGDVLETINFVARRCGPQLPPTSG